MKKIIQVEDPEALQYLLFSAALNTISMRHNLVNYTAKAEIDLEFRCVLGELLNFVNFVQGLIGPKSFIDWMAKFQEGRGIEEFSRFDSQRREYTSKICKKISEESTNAKH